MKLSAQHKPVSIMGMDLEQWTHKSCTADIGECDDWATIYLIESTEKRKGHATALLMIMKVYYERQGKRFGSSVALNDGMRRLLKKLKITEYK